MGVGRLVLVWHLVTPAVVDKRRRANVAHVRQSRPHSGHGLYVGEGRGVEGRPTPRQSHGRSCPMASKHPTRRTFGIGT